MSPRKVAVLGTRYADLAIEEEVLGPLDVTLVLGDGGSADEILEVASDAEVGGLEPLWRGRRRADDEPAEPVP